MVNKVILLGFAGAEPEFRTLESGVSMARMRMATTERWLNHADGQWKELTQWHEIVIWRDMAQYAYENIDKGAMVYIEGRIRMRENKCEIIADVLKVLRGKLFDAKRAHRNSTTNNNNLYEQGVDIKSISDAEFSDGACSANQQQKHNVGKENAFSKFVDEFAAAEDDLPF